MKPTDSFIEYTNQRGMHVIHLHASADPEKADPRWRQTMQERFGGTFDREIDMNFFAEVGSRVFEQVWMEHGDRVVMDPLWENVPGGLEMWASMDWGLQKPTSVHEYVKGNGTNGTVAGRYYCVWEFYMKNLKENPMTVIDVLKRRGNLNRYKHFFCDPSMRNRSQVVMNARSAVSIVFWFLQKGITLTPAMDKSDKTCVTKLVDLIQQGKFHVFRSCPKMIWELPKLIYDPDTEVVTSISNHAYDDLKYWLLSQSEIHAAPVQEVAPDGLSPTERYFAKQHMKILSRWGETETGPGENQWSLW